ncbi:hypothetical protein SCA6_015048 [Theobroma cacao]
MRSIFFECKLKTFRVFGSKKRKKNENFEHVSGRGYNGQKRKTTKRLRFKET